MIAFFIVFAVLLFIALLRFGIDVEYSADGFVLTARAGPFRMRVFPREEKPDKPVEKIARRARKKEVREKPDKKPGGLKAFSDILSAAKTALSRLRRRLLIKKLTIRYVAAGDDPFNTALSFGAANAAIAAIVPALEKNFRIKRRDLSAGADFMAAHPVIYANAAVSLAVWEAVYVAFALFPLLKMGRGAT